MHGPQQMLKIIP